MFEPIWKYFLPGFEYERVHSESILAVQLTSIGDFLDNVVGKEWLGDVSFLSVGQSIVQPVVGYCESLRRPVADISPLMRSSQCFWKLALAGLQHTHGRRDHIRSC